MPSAQLRNWSGLASWKARVRACLVAGLGEEHNLVSKLDKTSYTPSMTVNGGTADQYNRAYLRGLGHVRSYIDAAIYELEMRAGDDDIVHESSYDPLLWEHVRGLVEDEDWGKVSSQVAIFTEHQVRVWSQAERSVVGKGLYAKALADDGTLRLGSQKGEWEGWRALGTGFAQATSNVDRHNLASRSDAKRYAIGVLGLASLLLTQMRYQHPEVLGIEKDSEA